MRYRAAYQPAYVTGLLEVVEERRLEIPVTMVIGFVQL